MHVWTMYIHAMYAATKLIPCFFALDRWQQQLNKRGTLFHARNVGLQNSRHCYQLLCQTISLPLGRRFSGARFLFTTGTSYSFSFSSQCNSCICLFAPRAVLYLRSHSADPQWNWYPLVLPAVIVLMLLAGSALLRVALFFVGFFHYLWTHNTIGVR